MATEIDSLEIKIKSQANSATKAIDNLISRLNILSTSLTKVSGNSLVGLGKGVQSLSVGMQGLKGVGEAKFIRLANGINQLANVNSQGINNASNSLNNMTRTFNNLQTISSNSVVVAELARNLSRLGSASMQRAVTNIPQLANALNNLMITLSKSPRVSQNVIQMANAMANLASQGSKVGSASRSMQNGLNRVSTSAEKSKKSFNGLASAIGKFYASYFLVIRGIKGLWSSIESTADYIEAYNYFNVALGKIGSDWSHEWEKYASEIGVSSAEEYADSFKDRLSNSLKDLSGVQIQVDADGNGMLSSTGMKNLGLNIQEVTQYASQLASVTNSVGQTGEVSLATASAFSKLGADMSSLFNVDYSSVMNNLQSGLIGQSRALYKYGIDITNATLQTKAYELGLTKSVSEMTQMEKMQLRTLVILQDSRVAWGDLANRRKKIILPSVA